MATTKDMDRLLQSFVDEGGLPGCGLKITQHENVIYEGYFGFSDLETKAPVTETSLFRQASTSKLPMYTAAMMLYEKGKFLMSDPLYHFFPEYRTSHKVIRNPNGGVEIVETDRPLIIKDIFTMSCGLPYCNTPHKTGDVTQDAMVDAMQPLWEKGHYTLREHIRAISKVPLAFEPGTHWLYGFASELTAALIEEVTGKTIDDALQELIFDPLEMNNTRSHFFGNAEDRLVKLYTRDNDNTLKRIEVPFDKTMRPGKENEAGWARLFAPVGDYSNLMQMLANGGKFKGETLIGRKTIDMMRTRTLNEIQQKDYFNPYEAGYSYGYGVRTLVNKAEGNLNGSYGAFGWTGGFGSWVESDPEEGVSFVYMHNLIPNFERYYHPRIRTVVNALIH